MLEKLMGNKSLQKIFLNQFKKLCKDEGIKSLFIKVDEQGNGQAEQHTDEMICIKLELFDRLKESLKEYIELQKILKDRPDNINNYGRETNTATGE